MLQLKERKQDMETLTIVFTNILPWMKCNGITKLNNYNYT